MAIIKDYLLKSGFTAEYHRLIKVEINSADQKVYLTVAIYATAALRASGAEPAWHENPEIPFSYFESDPRISFYLALMDSPDSYLLAGLLITLLIRRKKMKVVTLILLVGLCGCSSIPPAHQDNTSICKSTVSRCGNLHPQEVARMLDRMPRPKDMR